MYIKMEQIDMATQKIENDGVKVPEGHVEETSTEKFLRECAERAALPEPKKVRKAKKSGAKPGVPWPFPKGETSPPNPYKMSKRKALEIARKACPWFIRPGEIHKEVFTLLKKGHSSAFAKQYMLVSQLSFKVSDYFEQLGAMNPGLLEAQQDGTIEKKIWETVRELNEAWKKLVEIP